MSQCDNLAADASNTRLRFEQLENNTHRTIIVRGLPASSTVFDCIQCLGVSADDMQKTEAENKPEHYFRRNYHTKQKECVITLKRAALAEKYMQNNRNAILDGHRLQLTLIDTKTILKVDHQSVRISHLPPDISLEKLVDVFTNAGEISVGEDGKPDVQFLFKFKKQTIVKITFDSADSADRCVARNGEPFSEEFPNVLKIRLFEIRENCDSKSSNDRPKDRTPKKSKDNLTKYTVVPNVVYVRGFPKHFADADLSKLVDACGKMVRVVIYKDEKNVSKGAGTISFAEPSSATSCVEKFNGLKLEGWDRSLQISAFKSRVEYNNKEIASQPGQTYECIICFESYDGKDVLNCVPIVRGLGNRETHFTCQDCVANHARALCSDGIVAKGGTGIPCGFPGCKRAILRAHLTPLLDDDTKKQLEQLMDKMALVNIKGMECCKSCNAGLILPNKWKMQFFPCENKSCGAHYCRFCKIDFDVHIGKRCRDVDPQRRKEKERKKYEEALSRAVIRECRKCRLAYQKLDGCNKMTCSQCGTTQCYVCRKSFIGYDHFGESLGKCRLFEMDNQLNPDEENLNAVRRNARENEWLAGVDL